MNNTKEKAIAAQPGMIVEILMKCRLEIYKFVFEGGTNITDFINAI
jgi:hypothetical protein